MVFEGMLVFWNFHCPIWDIFISQIPNSNITLNHVGVESTILSQQSWSGYQLSKFQSRNRTEITCKNKFLVSHDCKSLEWFEIEISGYLMQSDLLSRIEICNSIFFNKDLSRVAHICCYIFNQVPNYGNMSRLRSNED